MRGDLYQLLVKEKSSITEQFVAQTVSQLVGGLPLYLCLKLWQPGDGSQAHLQKVS
jgi:hypothetical protein